MSTPVDIAMGFDRQYAPHAGACIASIVTASPGATFRFLLLHADIDATTRARIETCAPGSVFVWIAVGEEDVPPFADRSHFTRATLFRLGLEKLAPADCEKVLYIDADVTVLADVRALAAADLQGNALGAVEDPNVDASEFATRWSLSGPPLYFNAGILVVDLVRVRAGKLFSKAIGFLAQNGAQLPWNDQDALNWACWGGWLHLDPVWNVQRSMAIAKVARALPMHQRIDGRAPKIVHYTGTEKPWIARAYHPWSLAYWRSLSRTPFVEEVASQQQGVGAMRRAALHLRWLRRKPKQTRRIAPLGRGSVDVSLIIATRNRDAQLQRCFDAVAALTFAGGWELVVVDNGSTDDTSAVIEANRAKLPVKLVHVYEPKAGLGRARNAGIAVANGRVIAFTDDDCYVAPDYLSCAVAAFADETLGFVTGRVELYDPTDAPITVNTSRIARRYLAHRYLHTDSLIGANLAFRREALDQIGGFDENLGAGTPFAAEDVDAGARAANAGWDGAYDPSMVVSHHHGRKARDVIGLYRSYNIGRGAYNVKYLLRGQFVPFLKGIAAIRWRMGDRATALSTPIQEFQGAAAYSWSCLKRCFASF